MIEDDEVSFVHVW